MPRGVALMSAVFDGERYILVSDRLTHDQEIAARVIAALHTLEGNRFVLVSTVEVMAALHAAA